MSSKWFVILVIWFITGCGSIACFGCCHCSPEGTSRSICKIIQISGFLTLPESLTSRASYLTGNLFRMFQTVLMSLHSLGLSPVCDDQKVLTVHMAVPVNHSKAKGQTVQIIFHSHHDIENALKRIFGEEKQWVPWRPWILSLWYAICSYSSFTNRNCSMCSGLNKQLN